MTPPCRTGHRHFPPRSRTRDEHARRIRRLHRRHPRTAATCRRTSVAAVRDPLTRILALSTSAVEQRGNETSIIFARNPVQLPPTVATLVDELVATAITHPLARKTGSPFLFPSPTVPGTARHARPAGWRCPTSISRSGSVATPLSIFSPKISLPRWSPSCSVRISMPSVGGPTMLAATGRATSMPEPTGRIEGSHLLIGV